MAQPASAAQEVLLAPPLAEEAHPTTLPTDNQLQRKEVLDKAAIQEFEEQFLGEATPEQADLWREVKVVFLDLQAVNKQLRLDLGQQRDAQQQQQQQQQQQAAPPGG